MCCGSFAGCHTERSIAVSSECAQFSQCVSPCREEYGVGGYNRTCVVGLVATIEPVWTHSHYISFRQGSLGVVNRGALKTRNTE